MFQNTKGDMSGRAAKYKNLIIFGCLAYPHINQGKLDIIALKEVFVSYLDRVKRCKIWCKQHKSAISRDMTLNTAALIKEKVTSDMHLLIIIWINQLTLQSLK